MVTEISYSHAKNCYEVTFNPYRYQIQRRRLLLTGSFSCWNYEQSGVAGLYLGNVEPGPVTLEMEPGTYEYKYYDLEADAWLEIPHEPEIYWGEPQDYRHNPYGTLNCHLHLP